MSSLNEKKTNIIDYFIMQKNDIKAFGIALNYL